MAKYSLKEAFLKEFHANKTDFTHELGNISDKEASKAVDVLGTSQGDETGAHGPVGIHRATEDEIDAAVEGGDLKGLKESEEESLEECGCGDAEPMNDTELPHPHGDFGPTELVVIKLGHEDNSGLNVGDPTHVEYGAPGGPDLDEEGHMAREEDDPELVAEPIPAILPMMHEATQNTSRWQQLAGMKVVKEELSPELFHGHEPEEHNGAAPLDPSEFEEPEEGSLPLDPATFEEESMMGATGGPSPEGAVLETPEPDPFDDFSLDHLKDDDPDAMVDIGDEPDAFSPADEEEFIADLLGDQGLYEEKKKKWNFEKDDSDDDEDEDEARAKAMEDEEDGRSEQKGSSKGVD